MIARAMDGVRPAQVGGPSAQRTSKRRPRVEMTLAGGFAIEVDGGPVTVPGPGQRVLAFLALQRRPVRRVYVCGSLWPDEAEPRSGARLRGALSRLRGAGLDVVLAIDDRLQLDPDVIVDVHEIAAATEWLDDPARLPEDCERWIAALGGELLPDWYDEWTPVERERHRQLRLHALEALCRSLTAAGRYLLAIQAGLAAVEADALRESAHRALIRAHLQEGNPSEALRQYRRFRDAVEEELGIAPTDGMEDLIHAFRPVPHVLANGAHPSHAFARRHRDAQATGSVPTA
jgi:DNA-binding SARP family transcriptional activator